MSGVRGGKRKSKKREGGNKKAPKNAKKAGILNREIRRIRERECRFLRFAERRKIEVNYLIRHRPPIS